MKRLKWLLFLLVTCCLIGCGKGDEAAKADKDVVEESKEDASKDDEKDVEKDKENKEDKKDDKGEEKEDTKPTAKPAEKQPVPYSVTQTNKFEIDGTWYDATGTYELIIDVEKGNDLPNIAIAVLTDGYVNAGFFLDESHRESDNVIYSCSFEGARMNAKLTFTEDGIWVENHELLDGKVLFTRPEGYVKSAQAAGHAVTQKNRFEVNGTWYNEEKELELIFEVCDWGYFPTFATVTVTDKMAEETVFLDEQYRESDTVIYGCNFNLEKDGTKITFKEEGILLEGNWFTGRKSILFTRPEGYVTE